MIRKPVTILFMPLGLVFLKLFTLICPELRRFCDGAPREVAWQRAFDANRLGRKLLGAGLLSCFVVMVIGSLVAGTPFGGFGSLITFPIVLMLGGICVVWLGRRSLRRSLRQQLVEQGIPICVECGYNLRASEVCPECGTPVRCTNCHYILVGNVSGRCPECGTPSVEKLLRKNT